MRLRLVYIVLLVVCSTQFAYAQTEESMHLSFARFMDIVRTHHPVAKQAELLIEQGSSAKQQEAHSDQIDSRKLRLLNM